MTVKSLKRVLKFKYRAGALALALCLFAAGCQTGGGQESEASAETSQESEAPGEAASGETAPEEQLSAGVVQLSDMFDDEDFEIGYDEDASAQSVCSGTGARCDSDAVEISGTTITITDEGTYILSGTLDDGMVMVDAGDNDTVRLVLNGVSVSNAAGAAIYVREADKVFVTTAADTQNSLSNGGEYIAIDDNNIDSVIFSKSDLILNGAGTLTIEAQAGHGVVSKDDLKITSGSYEIQSASHGLSGKDSVRIAGGSFVISAGKDGIQAENDEDAQLGFLYIADGSFAIDSVDDGVHSNADVTVSGGSFQIASGDDGFHADGSLTVTAGTILITQSYEGLEGLTIDITGGEIQLVSDDDGLNAAGGNDESGFGGFGGGRGGMDSFDTDSDAYIQISGGSLIVDASGDGIDSNGSLTISGGEVYISGPDSGADAALDYGLEAVVTGGVVIAAGASQMTENFGTSSTQGAMLAVVEQQEAGSEIRLLDEAGEELVSFRPAKAYDAVIVSCPQLEEGGSYTLVTGSAETEVTMDSLIYSSGQAGGINGFGGGMNPGRGGGPGGAGGMERPEGETGSAPEDLPEGEVEPPDWNGETAPQDGTDNGSGSDADAADPGKAAEAL